MWIRTGKRSISSVHDRFRIVWVRGLNWKAIKCIREVDEKILWPFFGHWSSSYLHIYFSVWQLGQPFIQEHDASIEMNPYESETQFLCTSLSSPYQDGLHTPNKNFLRTKPKSMQPVVLRTAGADWWAPTGTSPSSGAATSSVWQSGAGSCSPPESSPTGGSLEKWPQRLKHYLDLGSMLKGLVEIYRCDWRLPKTHVLATL